MGQCGVYRYGTVNKKNDRAFPIPPTVHNSHTQSPSLYQSLTSPSPHAAPTGVVVAQAVVDVVWFELDAVVEAVVPRLQWWWA